MTLRLTGAVTDAPIPNAIVTATVGTETFTTTADANGVYSLDIEANEDAVDSFVTLNAKGVGEQSFVEFTSLAGSFGTLTAAAGNDGTLSSEESFTTQITNVSTAEAVLLMEANGGQPITTDAALSTLGGGLDAQKVLDLAATIKLLVDESASYPMPNGATSILALASDANARRELIDNVSAQDPSAFAEAQNAIASDPTLVQPITVESLGEGFTTAMLSTDPGFSFNYSNRVMHFDLAPNGTGSVSTASYDVPMTWAIEGSTVRVTYNSPVQTVSWDTENCVGDGGVRQVEAHYSTQDVVFSFLGKRTVAITESSHVTYADCASLQPRDVTATSARTILTEDDLLPIEIAELNDSTHTIYVFDDATDTVVADIADLSANGTGTTRLSGKSFTWQLGQDAKSVMVTFTDGTVGEYFSLRDIDEVTSDLFFELRTVGGAVYMDIGASVYADPDYAVEFSTEDVPGRFYQFGLGEETSADTRLKGFRLRFDADGTGTEEVDYIDINDNVAVDDKTTQPFRAFRWTVEDGEVVVRRTFDPGTTAYNCLYTAPGCVLWDERRILPIAADENRIYWLEERRQNDFGVDAGTPATKLVRFYDFEPLTGLLKTHSASSATPAPRAPTRLLPAGAARR